MHSIAFHLFGMSIHWYGIMIAIGFLAALLLLQYKRSYAGMTADQIFDIGIIAVLGGVIGARIFYVIQFHQQFTSDPLKVFRIDQGGLVFYGGFLLVLVILWLYAKWKKLSIARIFDLYAPAMALGHAFGRIGCFLQGCCFGRPAEHGGVVFPSGSAPSLRFPDLLHPKILDSGKILICSQPLYPVQLYEAGANLLLAVLLLLLFKRVKKVGQIAAAYFIGYGLIRFGLEFLRGDHTDFILGMTPSQFIGVVIMVPCGVLFFLFFGKYGEDAYAGKPE
jgi:prolipoprotein diacylglyceryl transferase